MTAYGCVFLTPWCRSRICRRCDFRGASQKTFPPTAAMAAAISGMGAGVEEMLPTWVLNALGKDKGAALVATPFTEGALHGKTTPPT